jgi:hypothetical protein
LVAVSQVNELYKFVTGKPHQSGNRVVTAFMVESRTPEVCYVERSGPDS